MVCGLATRFYTHCSEDFVRIFFQIVVTLGLYIHQFSALNSRLNVSLGVIKYSVMIIDLVYTLLNKTIDLQQDNIGNLLILAFHISKLSF